MFAPNLRSTRSVCARLGCGLILVACTFHSSASAQTASSAKMRTWHAATGGFKVEAELVDVRENKAQLSKADGTTLWVPLDKLSLADVKYIQAEMARARKALTETPAEEASAQPQTIKEKLRAAAARNSATPKTAPAKEEPAVDTPAEEPAMEEADAMVEDEGSSSGGKATRSPFAGMRSINLVLGQISAGDMVFPDVLSPWVAVRKHGASGYAYQVVNIRTGKWGEPFPVEGHANAVALSPDGSTLAVASGFPAKLAFYSTANGKKGKELTLPEGSNVSGMVFPTPQQVLTLGGFRTPAPIIDVKTGKQVKTIDLENNVGRKFAVSPDGKLLAVPATSLVAIYDLKAGKRKTQLAIVPSSGTGYCSVEDLAFCNDGAELAVLCSSSASEFQVFSMRTGKAVIKHTLSERSTSFNQHGQYKGPAIEPIPGNKGYILYGCAIVDKDNGGPIWVDKTKSGEFGSEFRVLIDDQRQLKLTGDYGAKRFEIVELPWSEISKSKDTVAKGGTVEDAGLPAVKNVSAQAAKPVGKSKSAKLYTGTRLTDVPEVPIHKIPFDSSQRIISSLRFGSPASGKCVSLPPVFSPSGPREAIVIDLKKGEVAQSVDVQFLSQVTDISPSAEWLVGTTGKSNDRVDIFNLKTGKHVVGFRPGGNDGSGMSRLSSVTFLSEELLVTQMMGMEAVVWQFPELKAIYKFNTLGPIFRFPSSPLFLHRNEQGWCVRNNADGETVGYLEGSEDVGTEFLRSVSFRADESACVGITGMANDQRLIAWDLLTGKRIVSLSLSLMPVSRELLHRDLLAMLEGKKRIREEQVLNRADSASWVGENEVLLRWQRNDSDRFAQNANISSVVYSLFSLTEGRVLWDYRLPTGITFEGGPEGQIWFFEGARGQHALVGLRVPSELSKKEIAKAPAPRTLVGSGNPSCSISAWLFRVTSWRMGCYKTKFKRWFKRIWLRRIFRYPNELH